MVVPRFTTRVLTHWAKLKPTIAQTLYLLVSSADNFCKQFEPRSGPTFFCKQFEPRPGPTKCRAWSGSILFDTLMVFLNIFSKKVSFEKTISRWPKSMQNYPVDKVFRPPDKSVYWKTIFFISHPKHMLWVLSDFIWDFGKLPFPSHLGKYIIKIGKISTKQTWNWENKGHFWIGNDGMTPI